MKLPYSHHDQCAETYRTLQAQGFPHITSPEAYAEAERLAQLLARVIQKYKESEGENERRQTAI